MKNRLYSLIIGLIVIAVTVFLYLVLVDDIFSETLLWVCLSALLASEIIATCTHLFMGKNPRHLPIFVAFTLQTVFTLGISVLFINLYIDALLRYLMFYVVSLAIATIVAVFVLHHDRTAAGAQKNLKTAKTNMMSIRAMVNNMMNAESGKNYRPLLKQLDENLRFSDDSVTDDLDNRIYNSIRVLSEKIGSPDYDVEAAVNSVNDLIKQRNFMVKNKKTFR